MTVRAAQRVQELPIMDRKVILLVAQGYNDKQIANMAQVIPSTVDSVLRSFREQVRCKLQRAHDQEITRLDMALYILQHIITQDEQAAWTAEAEAAIKLLTDCNLLDEKARMLVSRAAEPSNFGLEPAALARAIGKYNSKIIQQILQPLWKALDCSPIRLRTIFYLIARRDEQTGEGSYV